jgi:AraC-like DNA-binding protein
MELVMGDRRWPVGPGETAMVPAGAMHRDAFETAEDLDILFCSFTWPPADAYFQRVDNDTLAQMSTDRRTQLRAMFDQLRADPPGEGPVDRTLLQVRLLAILVFILRQETGDAPAETQNASRRLMLRAKEYIHTHYGEYIGLEDIAAALHVSPYHLCHVFSRESDFTLFGYVMQVRMNEAKKLLRTSRLNVSEIGRAVGYRDPNYFSKAFRKHVGQSPTGYAASKPSD